MTPPPTESTLSVPARDQTAGPAGWRMARWNLARTRDTLRSLTFWLVGLVALFTLVLAFQIPYTYTVDFGARPSRFVIQGGMHEPETDAGQTYRWTRGRAELVLPALVSGAWALDLRVLGIQPEGNATVEIQAGESVFNRETGYDWEDWTFGFDVPAGDLPIVLDSETFKPSDQGGGDTRTLGVRVASLALRPESNGLSIPPLVGHVLPLTLGVMLVYAAARLAELSERYTLALTAVVIFVLAAVIALYRVYLNDQVVWTWLLALGGGLIFMLFGVDLVNGLYRRLGLETDRTTLNRLGLIVLGFFILKVVGSFYPQMYIIDQLFHLHRLEFIEQGNLFFVTRSREFGSLETVYPPALYIFLSPLASLVGADLGLFHLGVPLAEAVGAFLLFAVARLAKLAARAGLFAVLLYLGAPIAFITFGWGVYANLFAQQVLILTLALWFATRGRQRPLWTAALLTFVLIIGLLSHASFIILLTLYWGLVAAGRWLFSRQDRQRPVLVFAALGVALLVAFGVYFSFFVDKTLANLGELQSNAASASGEGFERVVGNGMAEEGLGLLPVRVHSPVEWVLEGVSYLARETWVYYRTLPVLFALLGLVWMWRDPTLQELALVVGVGILLVVTFFLVGMLLNVYTRYMLFGAPFIALGASHVLDRLATRGLAGRAVVILTLGLAIVSGIGFWFTRVVY